MATVQTRLTESKGSRLAFDDETSSTFAHNTSLPIHRWFRFPAGFSAPWVSDVIRRYNRAPATHVLDPFAGSGTVLLESERSGATALGIEAHPFLVRVGCAKLLWRESPSEFHRFSSSILSKAMHIEGKPDGYPKLVLKCYPQEVLRRLDALRTAWSARADGTALSELTWLALTAILRACSPVGTAPWQYILPRKRKMKPVDPFRAFDYQVRLMGDDMATRQQEDSGIQARLFRDDARTCSQVDDGWAHLVITSPPYANNYDYADATRLEMSFFGEIQDWGDLQLKVRKYLMRACTQHVSYLNESLGSLLRTPRLDPIRNEISEVCAALENEQPKHGGKKAYHLMIAAYFTDLSEVWSTLRRKTSPGATVCFVIGDSAPYGVYVPVERWLGELAVAAGFKSYNFEKLRDRNLKWKTRKHRVPLHEGRLWVQA